MPQGTKPQVVQHLFQVVSRDGILLVSLPMKNSYMSFDSNNIFLFFLQHAVRRFFFFKDLFVLWNLNLAESSW